MTTPTPLGPSSRANCKAGSSWPLPAHGAGEGRRLPFAPAKPGEFSIGHVVGSRAEVDALLAQAQVAGATLTDRPHDRPWGIYSGYFRDLDGHLWEIIGTHASTAGPPNDHLASSDDSRR